MPKHFGAQHVQNGYAAMGNHANRPRYAGMSNRSVADSIAAERRKAAREAAARKAKK
jgi:hypothetical protein